MNAKRLLAGLLTFVMLVGMLPMSVLAARPEEDAVPLEAPVEEAEQFAEPTRDAAEEPQAALAAVDTTGLVNITRQCAITTLSDTGDKPKSNLYDGSYSTLWGQNSAFPGEVTFGLPHQGEKVKTVILSFEQNKAAWGVTVTLTADGTQVDQQVVASFNDKYIYTFETAQEVSTLKVGLSNPTNDGGAGSFWPALAEAEIWAEPAPGPYDGLIDLAPKSTITVPSSQDGKGPDKMTDGDLSSLWINNGGNWPCDVMIALPGNAKVRRIEINFESHSDRTMDVTLKKALSGITSDMTTILPTTRHTMSETLVFTNDSEGGEFLSHLQITLNTPRTNGAAGAFWPNIAEVKIWAIDETIDLKNYTNITEHTTETSGSNYKEWNFGSNQQVAGFKVTLAEGATAVLKGKLKRGKTWTTYIQALHSGDNVLDYVTGMSAVRVELSDPAQLAGFQIWGTYTEPEPPDPNNLSFDKPTHSNFNDTGSYLAVDGNTASGWTADMYPAYLDIDLEANYNLSEITVFTPTNGYTQYTVYTSMDGLDFDLVDDHSKNTSPGTDSGDVITLSKEARIVRVYLEYYSVSSRPTLNEVKIKGTPSGTAVQIAPAVTVTPFEETEYAARITDADVYNAVKSIIDRQINQKNPNSVDYREWFTFALADDPNGYDYFTLTDEGGKIKVTGNNGVSLATGVNHYLKYFCNVHISQVGNQVNMPDSIVPINGTVHKETKYPVRYAYNYCTHSYTMSFWNDEEWQNELDWQALNGVNVVLDITGQEEVWREFLMSVGYTHQEAKDFLAGPGYYAWAYMANLTGFGGPIHDSFLTERVELARKNQRFMRVLGMEPVLQAFSGMVPVDLTAHDPDAKVIAQGVWQRFQRPYMLKTDEPSYDEYATKFYDAQRRVLGDAKYYATDPFHEGGNTGGMNPNVVSRELVTSLVDNDPDAVWIIQSWLRNPSNELLQGLREGGPNHNVDMRSHALILDLWAEHTPHNETYGVDTDRDGRKEFTDTPWVWCMLNNFGGRMGLHGHLDALQQGIPTSANASKHMAGIGMSPEGAQENPVLYDFLFETIWTDDADEDLPVIDLDQWLKDYVTRRYGSESESAYQAMLIMAETVYKSSLNMEGQGSPESAINGRPSLEGGKASTWGNGTIGYSKAKLEQALKLLLADYDTLKTSDAYLYDVADVLKQHLSNYATGAHQAMASAYTAGNADAFNEASASFLTLIDEVEKVLGTRSEFTFGKWTGGAEKMAENADAFTQRLYLRNAKALVTTWGSIEQGNAGGLKDYSNRQWAGLTNDFYKVRWQKWIDAAKAKLGTTTDDPTLSPEDWFAWEWAYARDAKSYSSAPSGLDLKALADEVLANYSVLEPLGEKDLDPANMTVKAGSEETVKAVNTADNVLDRDSGSIWHTSWSSPPSADRKWIAIDMGAVNKIDGLRYLPRQNSGTNGNITQYDLYISSDDSAWADPTSNTGWECLISGGTWTNDASWKEISFAARSARYVKLLSKAGAGGFASAAEIRITAPSNVPVESVTLDQTSATLYTNGGEGHTVTLTPTVLPANATNKAVNWSVSPSSIASVENGVVTAVGNGTATITATSQDDPTKTAACTVTVKTKITGQVLIRVEPVGEAVFGSTLTASLGNITEAAKEHLSYAWYHSETAEGTPIATTSSYTLKQTDIGQKITLKITAIDFFEGSSTATTEQAVGKAAGENMQADPTSTPCTNASTDDGTITGLHADRRYQYQKQNDDGSWPETWEDVPANSTSISGRSHGNYRVRRWFDPATHTPGSFANVHVGIAGVPEYAVNRPNDDGNGNYVRALPRPAEEDATVTVTVTTVTGWVLESLTATNVTTQEEVALQKTAGKDDEYTFTMPASAVTLTPVFVQRSYHITYALTHADVSGDKPASVPHGQAFEFTLAPESEYYQLPVRILVTDADGHEVAHTYRTHPTNDNYKVVGFVAGLDRDITVTVTAETRTHHIGHNLTNINCDLGDEEAHKVAHKAALDIHLTPAEGYRLPSVSGFQITVGGSALTAADYTFSRRTGILSIAENVITGPVEITAAGEVITDPLTIAASPVSLSGGGQVVLTVTVPADAFDAVKDGLDLANGTSTQLAVTCGDSSIHPRPSALNLDNRTVTFTASLPNATRTYPFTATLAAVEETDYPEESVSCTVSVTKTGGSGSSASTPSDTTTTETKDDGTKVTTVTKPDGSTTTTTETPDGTKEVVEAKKDGTITATTETPDGTVAVVETKPDGSKTQTVEQPDGTKSELAATKDGDVTITVTDKDGEELVKTEIPATIPEPETKFVDLAPTPWADEAIHKMAGLELVEGTGDNKYSPVASMTRGSLATVLHRLSQGKTDYETTFKDVAQGKYYSEGVAWAAKVNVVTGYNADTFAPEDIITREQLAVMLARYAKLIGMNTKADSAALAKFNDGQNTGSWAVDGMAWCVENGIIRGKDGNRLDPTTNVSRAEVAVMLDRFIELLK